MSRARASGPEVQRDRTREIIAALPHVPCLVDGYKRQGDVVQLPGDQLFLRSMWAP
jgi:hypothetical protein